MSIFLDFASGAAFLILFLGAALDSYIAIIGGAALFLAEPNRAEAAPFIAPIKPFLAFLFTLISFCKYSCSI